MFYCHDSIEAGISDIVITLKATPTVCTTITVYHEYVCYCYDLIEAGISDIVITLKATPTVSTTI